jgi:hypothetical protein
VTIYRWLMIIVFASVGVWLLNFFGDHLAWRAAQPFEGLATITWVGDGTTVRRVGTAHKGGATGRIRTWQDGALVLVDGFSDPVMYRADPNTLTSWLHPGDRVRVRYKRGSFMLWERMDISNVTMLAH